MSRVVSLPTHTFTGQSTVYQYCAHSFARNWKLPYLNQLKGENDHRKYFMINLHERMLPTRQGQTRNLLSPVGRASNWATEAGLYRGTLWLLQLCPFSQFNTSFPCLQQIPTEINSFGILFFPPKMLNKIISWLRFHFNLFILSISVWELLDHTLYWFLPAVLNTICKK